MLSVDERNNYNYYAIIAEQEARQVVTMSFDFVVLSVRPSVQSEKFMIGVASYNNIHWEIDVVHLLSLPRQDTILTIIIAKTQT